MVRSIRNIEQGLGKNKKIYNKEKQIRKWATRSLVAVTDIEKGKKLQLKTFGRRDQAQEFHLDILIK